MKQPRLTKTLVSSAVAAAFLAGGSLVAGDSGKLIIDDKAPIECTPDPAFCNIFDYGELYRGDGFVSSVSLVGRYQGQFQSHSLDLDNGQSFGANYWEHRRFRVGTSIEFANGWEFFNNWNISDGRGSDVANEELYEGDFFGTIYEMFLKGEVAGVGVTIGKQKQKVTREWSTSSKRILTVERSHITNEVSGNVPWGISLSKEFLGMKHSVGFWNYGLYTEGPVGQAGPNTWDSDARNGFSYNLEVPLNDTTDLFFDYVFTDNESGTVNPQGTADNVDSSPYNHVVALGTESTWEIDPCREWGLITDLIWGIDREADGNTANPAGGNYGDAIAAGEDTFGLVLLGHYDVTEKLEFIAKYSYASLSRLQRPQARDKDASIPRFNLEDVHTIYTGLNYRICGDNLKLMAGYEYLSGNLNNGQGISGDSWLVGVRTYF